MSTPTVTNFGFSAGASSGTSVSISATAATGNQNTMMIVFFSTRNGGNATTATFNAVSMTKGSAGGAVVGYDTNYFFLPSPATGTHTLTVNYPTSGNGSGIGYVVIKDAVQSGGIDADGYTGANSATSTSQSVTTTVSNDLILAWFALWFGTSGWTEGGSQVRVGSTTSLGASGDYAEISSLPDASTGAQAMSLSWTGSEPNDVLAVAVKYQAPPSTANGNFLAFM